MSLINGMDDIMTYIKNQELRIQKLEQENKQLKQQNDAIMEDENSQHILGCNAYEKFMQSMSELHYDEKWLKELREENKQLKTNINMDKDIILNLILSLIATKNADLEWEMKDKYDIYEGYKNEKINELVKYMNDTDWNDDNYRCELSYENNYFTIMFKDTESEEEDEDE